MEGLLMQQSGWHAICAGHRLLLCAGPWCAGPCYSNSSGGGHTPSYVIVSDVLVSSLCCNMCRSPPALVH
eukprot:950177-Pelagomonas_calceolata.AAC.2